jgi:hypothetical protein
LAVENTKPSEGVQKVSKVIKRNQRLNPLCHSYIKTVICAADERAPHAGEAAGCWHTATLEKENFCDFKKLHRFFARFATYGAILGSAVAKRATA